MSNPMSEKQAAFRQTLIARMRSEQTAKYTSLTGLKERRGMAALQLALIAALPAPTTTIEASAQIDALKSGNLTRFASADPARYQPVIDRLIARYGDDLSGLPVDPAQMEVA